MFPRRQFRPLNPRPTGTKFHWAEYILLAVLVAVIAAGFGRLYAYAHEYVYPWLLNKLT